jgi:hypothetical protein
VPRLRPLAQVTVLVWLHLLGAALWLGGLPTLGLAVVLGSRTLPAELFQAYVRRLGWAFAALSALAWALIGVPGLLMAVALRWPRLAVEKAGLGAGIVVASAVHVATARLAVSGAARVAWRILAAAILVGTLLVFWLGVKLAEG